MLLVYHCSPSPQTLFAVKASGLLYILRTKFRHLSVAVRRQPAIGSMAMFTSALGLLQTEEFWSVRSLDLPASHMSGNHGINQRTRGDYLPFLCLSDT